MKEASGGNEIDYKTKLLDRGYQKKFSAAETIEMEFKFAADTAARSYGYPLVLTNKMISFSSDDQR